MASKPNMNKKDTLFSANHSSKADQTHQCDGQTEDSNNQRQTLPSRKKPVKKSFFEVVRAQEQVPSTTGRWSQNNKVKQKPSPWAIQNEPINTTDTAFDTMHIAQTTIDIEAPISNHIQSLRVAFDDAFTKHFVTNEGIKECRMIYNKLHDIILAKRQNSQITLYGAFLFKCGLEKSSKIDIDVQFEETSEYETLKILLDIIHSSEPRFKADINTGLEPLCINLVLDESNIRVQITCGYTKAIYLSKLIQIYTKFDERVLKLLRIVRIFSKICNTDRTDLGTLHPVVFHLMVIYFLQQLEEPILPCLHEHVYGINEVPVTLEDDQYDDFFRLSNQYVRKWKSKNTTSAEILFLQFLSYYVGKFDTEQFVISIQTRMPILKISKKWRKKLLACQDPILIDENLCSSLKAFCSHEFIQRTFQKALEYFSNTQEKDSVDSERDQCLKNKSIDEVHNSYRLFNQSLLSTITVNKKMDPGKVRKLYMGIVKTQNTILPESTLKPNRSNWVLWLDNDVNKDEAEEAFQPYFENKTDVSNSNENNDIVIPVEIISDRITNCSNDNQFEDSVLNDVKQIETVKDKDDMLSSFDVLCQGINKKQRRILQREFERQGGVINDKVKQLFESFKLSSATSSTDVSSSVLPKELPPPPPPPPINSTVGESSSIQVDAVLTDSKETNSHDNSSLIFYEFQAKHFGAEESAPIVCTICSKNDHTTLECPKLPVASMEELAATSTEWNEMLSRLCKHIYESWQLTTTDINNRNTILRQLQSLFQRNYPKCKLQAYGSFCNGFGFRNSDFDICFQSEENEQDNAARTLKKLSKLLYNNTFEYVHLLRHAKVPIIRSKHSQLNIEFDISIYNILAIENTRLLKTYAKIDPRVIELGYMMKYLAKNCDIGDVSFGTLSSYAYIIMVIHFLQQIQPPVLPVLQQINDISSEKKSTLVKHDKWDVSFFDDLTRLKIIWNKDKEPNTMTSGALWVALLRYYTEQFNYNENIVTIRQYEPLLRVNKGWFNKIIAIEDPFQLNRNLGQHLSIQSWVTIRDVFIRARERFCCEPKNSNMMELEISSIQEHFFNFDELRPKKSRKTDEDSESIDKQTEKQIAHEEQIQDNTMLEEIKVTTD